MMHARERDRQDWSERMGLSRSSAVRAVALEVSKDFRFATNPEGKIAGEVERAELICLLQRGSPKSLIVVSREAPPAPG